jgi:hypothetical protein
MYNNHCTFDWVWIVCSGEESFPTGTQPIPGELIPCQLASVALGNITSDDEEVNFPVPIAVVRPLQICHNPDQKEFRSFILKRWMKPYTPSGDPLFWLVPTTQVVRQAIVFEDFPTAFHSKSDFLKERAIFIEKNVIRSHSNDDQHRFLKKDWAYVVRPKNEWPEIFNDMTKGQCQEDTGYRPPDTQR